ncbi:hypothetical protein LguiA_002842 [Lonicera macranthoides]
MAEVRHDGGSALIDRHSGLITNGLISPHRNRVLFLRWVSFRELVTSCNILFHVIEIDKFGVHLIGSLIVGSRLADKEIDLYMYLALYE